ncbi:MAG: SsrA-binding protein [uncultured bacterium]|nr:MAG: SsrA-binding protein [uncultured bacterium]
MAKTDSGIKIICDNRKAHFNYELLDKYEAGIMLHGSEIKSLRAGKGHLNDAYAIVHKGEILLIHCHIGAYQVRNFTDHEPERMRKLLLHKQEISKLIGKVEEKGFTLIPTKMYFKNGLAKIEIAVGKSKKLYDKRETIKKRENDKNLRRVMKEAKR